MIIGNFYDDQFTDTLNLPFTVLPQRAYFSLDDVCVSTDSIYTNTWVGITESTIQENNISIYPNPVTNYLKIVSDITIDNLTFYDNSGRKIKNIKSQNMNSFEININDMNPGIYFLQIEFKNTTTFEK